MWQGHSPAPGVGGWGGERRGKADPGVCELKHSKGPGCSSL